MPFIMKVMPVHFFKNLEIITKQKVDQSYSEFHLLEQFYVHVLPLVLPFITMEESKFNGEKPSFSMTK